MSTQQDETTSPETSLQFGRGSWTVRIIVIALLLGLTAAMFGPFSREIVGLLAIGMMLVLIFIRVPVGFALIVPALVGLWALRGPRPVETLLGTLPYAEVSKWELSVIPMFIFMGLLLWRSGLTDTAYITARHWLGWMPGGLAVGTNTAGAGLAAISGSTVGTTFALSRIGIPEMLKAGYDRRLAIGSVMVAGLPGQLIPPSVFLVLYAGIAQVPVGPQLIAGVFPGVLIAIVCGVQIWLIATLRPQLAGGKESRQSFTWAERMGGLVGIWPLPVLIVVVIGGMFTGVITATEAGAVGALGALLITLWYRRDDKPLSHASQAAKDTVASSGSIFLLFVGAYALARLLAISGLGAAFTNWVTDLGLGRVSFLLLLVVAYIIMGIFLDPISMMLLTVPLLVPTFAEMGISPLWFGVFIVFMAELSVVSPPTGMLNFIVHKICQDPEVNQGQSIGLGDCFRAVAWFVPSALVFCLLLIFFPEVATFLPDRM